ncbi:hypothetical protein ACAW63_10935 [Pseudomonas sp. QE6]|uniref:hypothetical protein n=1 Tax=Pseudomonas sp. QE6 TaxID=3242491 RepID=UPI003528B123
MSTGQAILSIAGAVAGAVVTGGSPYGAYIGAQISAEISGFNDPVPYEQKHSSVAKRLGKEVGKV